MEWGSNPTPPSFHYSFTPSLQCFLFCCFLVVSNLGAVLQLPADRTVASGNNLIAWLHAAFDFGVAVVGDSSRNLYQVRFPALFYKHHLRQFFALFLLRLFFSLLVREVGGVIRFVALF